MAKKPNISEVKTTRELFSLMPPEHAAARAPELHAFIESEVLRQLKAEHHPINISVDMFLSFADNPYQVLDNEEMDELVQSIKERGILTPLIVMPKPNDAHVFELISGHRRLYAAQKAGLETVPAIVCNVNRDEAAIMVVDSNLHREHILPSEKAKAYKLRLDAMNHQGQRTDLTSAQVEQKLSVEQLAEVANESRAQIQRYIRLNNLIPELQSLVDENKIALTPAVELSYLTEDEQNNLLETIEIEDCTPSLSQAQQMRKLSAQGRLDMDAVFQTLTKPKPNQQPKISISMEQLTPFFSPDVTPKAVIEYILKLLEDDRKRKSRRRDREER